ncbi:DUF1214 domain-containing protein [Sphingobium estronivorans]|uniref:DUF1214 domain-containing protein n=1 Tax=Sphingobium estronivorans TaxID=1577690 RepID=UPI00123C6C09|nr:DUF1214 domain-containing protein [Sphingobium estronivorans]
MTTDKDTPQRIGGASAGGSSRKRFVRAEPRDDGANAARLKNGQAWADFCDAIKRSGEHMLAMDIDWSELDYVDAFHYLAGVVNGGIRTAIDHADPAVPMWVHNGNGVKHSGDNADNRYLVARLDPSKTYRLFGERRNCFDMMVEISQGYMQQGDARTYATVRFDEAFSVDPDGRFEIILGGEPRDGNWLPLDPEGRQLVIRCYFLDWESEAPPSIAIEQIGHEGLPPTPVTAARMAGLLDDAAAWIESNALFWTPWMEEYHRQRKAGHFNQAQSYVGGAKDILYGNNGYELSADEMLLLEFTPPDAQYWSFQLQNNAMVSMDYANHQTSLNCRQIRIDDDGVARIVVAHRDPGIANWLDTCGRTTGLLIWRWIWTQDNPHVTMRRIKADALDALLPAETVRLTPQERRAAIAIRQRHVALRERSC